MTKPIPDGRDWSRHTSEKKLAVLRATINGSRRLSAALSRSLPNSDSLSKEQRAEIKDIVADAVSVLLEEKKKLDAMPRMATVNKNIGEVVASLKAAQEAMKNLDPRSRDGLGGLGFLAPMVRNLMAMEWRVERRRRRNFRKQDKRLAGVPGLPQAVDHLADAYVIASPGRIVIKPIKPPRGEFVDFVINVLASVDVLVTRSVVQPLATKVADDRGIKTKSMTPPKMRRPAKVA